MIRPTNPQPALFEIADDGTTRRPTQPPKLSICRYRLELVAEASSLYEGEPQHGREAFSHPAAAARFLTREIGNRPQEHMCALYLDTRNRPLGWTVAHIGTINRAAVEPRSILVTGLGLNAQGFIMSHNHPSGDPTPSAEDLGFTRRMAEAGEKTIRTSSKKRRWQILRSVEHSLNVNHSGELTVENEPVLEGARHRKDANPRKSNIDRPVGTADPWLLGDQLEGLAAGFDKARRYVWAIRQQVVDAALDVLQSSELDAAVRTHLPLP